MFAKTFDRLNVYKEELQKYKLWKEEVEKRNGVPFADMCEGNADWDQRLVWLARLDAMKRVLGLTDKEQGGFYTAAKLV